MKKIKYEDNSEYQLMELYICEQIVGSSFLLLSLISSDGLLSLLIFLVEMSYINIVSER